MQNLHLGGGVLGVHGHVGRVSPVVDALVSNKGYFNS